MVCFDENTPVIDEFGIDLLKIFDRLVIPRPRLKEDVLELRKIHLFPFTPENFFIDDDIEDEFVIRKL
jgi:hypothetical protein